MNNRRDKATLDKYRKKIILQEIQSNEKKCFMCQNNKNILHCDICRNSALFCTTCRNHHHLLYCDKTSYNVDLEKHVQVLDLNTPLTQNQSIIRASLACQRSRIFFLPSCAMERLQNKTFYDIRSSTIFWTVQWTFIDQDFRSKFTNMVPENVSLSNLILRKPLSIDVNEQYLYKGSFYLANPKLHPRNFNVIDVRCTLQQILKGKIILEIPHILVDMNRVDNPGFTEEDDWVLLPNSF